MTVTRTPLRISFAGGGTDLKEFYENGYGAVVSMAIDKHIYIAVHRGFDRRYILKYSEVEVADTVDQIRHGLIRECLRERGIKSGMEMASFADIPSQGTGLGSSSAFAVGLLHALDIQEGGELGKADLADSACRIEIDRLGEPIGKQDQYAASFGGVNYIKFLPGGKVEVSPIEIDPDTICRLNENLLLVYTGLTRGAGTVLSEQKENTVRDSDTFTRLESIRLMADELRSELQKGKIDAIGDYLSRGWALKKELAKGVSKGEIDEIYEAGISAGAAGGKLLGAGGGGFVLFYCEEGRRADVEARFKNMRCISPGVDVLGTCLVGV